MSDRPDRLLLSWSSGKDSAWTLQRLRADPRVEVAGLITTINSTHGRVAMHATRRKIVDAQAAAVGLPLHIVDLPWPCPNGVYEQRMGAALEAARRDRITGVAFGDLLLEDVRDYRTKQARDAGLDAVFPLWALRTDRLAREMIDAGLRAVVTCVDAGRLGCEFVGRPFDHAFLDELPEGVDPCGENGEFHTCVLDAPTFAEPIRARVGEIVQREGFHFADLVPE